MHYLMPEGEIHAVDDATFEVFEGEVVGIVGESGSGKSSLVTSIVRLLPRSARIVGGKVFYGDSDILRASDQELRRLRWREIAIVFQGGMSALNPVFTVGEQLCDILIRRAGFTPSAARRRAAEALSEVGIAPDRMGDYPHQFSGGMKQRVAIAMSLLCRPKVLIADEPTTALDVLAQKDVLDLIDRLRSEYGIAVLYISHDLPMIARRCHRLVVMYAGQIVESGPVERIVNSPSHPYTKALFASMLTMDDYTQRSPILGSCPSLLNLSDGCRFRDRCPWRQPICDTDPPWRENSDAQGARCHFAGDGTLGDWTRSSEQLGSSL